MDDRPNSINPSVLFIQYGRTGADFAPQMGISYNKATGFIKTMEELGIVGATGTKP